MASMGAMVARGAARRVRGGDAMNLPYFQSNVQPLSLMQTNWRATLNPIIALPILNGVALTNVALIDGATIINTLLARMQQGWLITDINAAATVYRSAPFNNLTLTLTASAACTVSLWVY